MGPHYSGQQNSMSKIKHADVRNKVSATVLHQLKGDNGAAVMKLPFSMPIMEAADLTTIHLTQRIAAARMRFDFAGVVER